MEAYVSWKSVEECGNGGTASWEPALNPYRQVGMIFLLLLCYVTKMKYGGEDTDKYNPFSNSGLQILFGVVTADYYFAFRAALRKHREKEEQATEV